MNAKQRERSRGRLADDLWSWAALAFKCAACVAVIGLLAAIGLGPAGGDVTPLAGDLSTAPAP